MATESSVPHISFIGIVDNSQEALWKYMTGSVSYLLGYEPEELLERPSLELVHPGEQNRIRRLHYDTITQDKAACIVYLRMKHKDPKRGYILCAVSRTIVHNVTVGSVSFASKGAKALHNASTAQEITVVTPDLPELEFRRWIDPSPLPPDDVSPNMRRRPRLPSDDSSSSSSSSQDEEEEDFRYDPLPNQSFRTALILDRFSIHCSILYYSNTLLISANVVEGRSFFDFVAEEDKELVRTWIRTVKEWGVNERGQPSDGGFGFAGFSLMAEGDPARSGEPTSPRNRLNTSSSRRTKSRSARGSAKSYSPTFRLSNGVPVNFRVDSIFSAHSDGLLVILRRAPDASRVLGSA